MNRIESYGRKAAWPVVIALAAFIVAGCGGGGGGGDPVAAPGPGPAPEPVVVDAAGGVSTDPGSVPLGDAGTFVILAQAGVTNVPTSPITGNVGAHPITGAAIGVTCAEVTGTAPGKIFDTDGAYTGGGAADVSCRVTDATLLDTAVDDSAAAYGDAAGRTAGVLNLGGGTLSGEILAPGTYTWNGTSATLNITGDITLSGSATDVWIFQVAGNLNQSPATKVNLKDGALSKNVFWQVGGAATSIGTTAHIAGIVITVGSVALDTGASVDGRLYTLGSVTLEQNTVTRPAL